MRVGDTGASCFCICQLRKKKLLKALRVMDGAETSLTAEEANLRRLRARVYRAESCASFYATAAAEAQAFLSAALWETDIRRIRAALQEVQVIVSRDPNDATSAQPLTSSWPSRPGTRPSSLPQEFATSRGELTRYGESRARGGLQSGQSDTSDDESLEHMVVAVEKLSAARLSVRSASRFLSDLLPAPAAASETAPAQAEVIALHAQEHRILNAEAAEAGAISAGAGSGGPLRVGATSDQTSEDLAKALASSEANTAEDKRMSAPSSASPTASPTSPALGLPAPERLDPKASETEAARGPRGPAHAVLLPFSPSASPTTMPFLFTPGGWHKSKTKQNSTQASTRHAAQPGPLGGAVGVVHGCDGAGVGLEEKERKELGRGRGRRMKKPTIENKQAPRVSMLL